MKQHYVCGDSQLTHCWRARAVPSWNATRNWKFVTCGSCLRARKRNAVRKPRNYSRRLGAFPMPEASA